jgi:hypothetical protein
MRRIGLVAALGAAVLLCGAPIWPAVALASTGGGASTAVYQAYGYGYPTAGPWGSSWSGYGYPSGGAGGLSCTGNNYPGSGIAAWVGPSYPTSASCGWLGANYPSNGYYGLSASGANYPNSSSVTYYPAYAAGTSYGYGGQSYGPADYGTPYYGTSSGIGSGYYAPPALCGYAGAC